jgi:peptide/nickel transport system substrate-binding protein
MRRRDFLASTAAAAASALPTPYIRSAAAQSRKDTLLTVSETGPNSLDLMMPGANISCYEVGWNTYDRLATFGLTKGANGEDRYDPDNFQPELAESWDLGDMSLTFKLKKNATFHDGTPVTAKDVKWSFERALAVGGSPTFQMRAGSMEKPEQFVVVDDHTIRIDFIRKDRLTFPDLCVPTLSIFNSALAKQHAAERIPGRSNG